METKMTMDDQERMTKEQLIKLIKKHNMTSLGFANALGVSLGCIRKWRTGERKIPRWAKKFIDLKFNK